MAAEPAFTTYEAIGNREDLSDEIWDVSPIDTPFMSSIPHVAATGTKHEWQTDALAAAASNTNVDGADATTTSATATVRLFNYTQILDKVPMVSGSQEKVQKAGRGSEIEYQVAKMMKEIKRDLETALLANTVRNAGSNATTPVARVLGGYPTWVESNADIASDATKATGAGVDIHTDGTARAFTEAQFKTVLAAAFTAGGDPDTVSLGAFNKQVFSGFSGGSTRFSTDKDAKLVATIDVYRSDFGTMKIIPNRFQPADMAYIYDTNLFALAELRPLFTQDLARTGDSIRKQLLWEATLESRNENGSGIVTDLTSS